MKTYEYYKEKGSEWIDNNIAGLCGDVEMELVEETLSHTKYDVGNELFLYVNNSACDMIIREDPEDPEGEEIESWYLEQ